MSSSKSNKKKFHTGISKEKFDLLTTEGLQQAGGGLDQDFNNLKKSDRLRKNSTTVFDTNSSGKVTVDSEATAQAQVAEEERRAAFFQTISQKDLDELIVGFKKRQSELISSSQIQGRNQLIRTDR